MRGKLNTKMPAYPLSRITPADAGKTKGRTQKRALSWDHPRGCGENLVHLLRGLLPPGSPPRMRGKRASVRKSGVSIRITPADAGKTVKVGRPEIRDKDHPRGCGENISQMRSFIILPGSPPRMRGKQALSADSIVFNGITPADAGKT